MPNVLYDRVVVTDHSLQEVIWAVHIMIFANERLGCPFLIPKGEAKNSNGVRGFEHLPVVI